MSHFNSNFCALIKQNQFIFIKMKNEYTTSDLYCAAYLLAIEIGFLGFAKEPDSQKYEFVFENPKRCEQAVYDFLNRKSSVCPKTYAEAIRSLKDMLFAVINDKG